jgi:hypothetical protein
MLASPELLADFVMVAQEPHLDRVVQIEKQEAKLPVPAALEQVPAQLADANAAVGVRLTESLRQLEEGVPTFIAIGLGQASQPGEDGRSNDERFFHAFSAGQRR